MIATARTIREYITVPLVGYLILAGGTVYAIDQTGDNAREQRDALATQTYETQLAGCARNNELREALVSVLQASKQQTDEAIKKGDVPANQREQAHAFYDSAIAKVSPVDCKKVYPKPPGT